MGVCLDLVAHFYHDFDIWKIVIDNVLKSWLLWIWIIIIVPMICLRVVAHSHHDLDICMNYEHVIKSWSSSQWFAWEWWRPEAWQSHCSRPRLPQRGLRLPPEFSFATFKPSSHSLQKMTHSITAFHILKHVLIKCSQLFTFSAAFLSFAIFASKVQSFLIFCSNRLLFDAFATLELGLTFQHMEGKRQHHRSAELPWHHNMELSVRPFVLTSLWSNTSRVSSLKSHYLCRVPRVQSYQGKGS